MMKRIDPFPEILPKVRVRGRAAFRRVESVLLRAPLVRTGYAAVLCLLLVPSMSRVLAVLTLRRPRCVAHWFCVGGIMTLMPVTQLAAWAADSPDPVALQQAVEAARTELPPGELQMVVEYNSDEVRNVRRLEAVFEGERRRVRQSGAGAATALFDSKQVFLFDGSSATIREISHATADFLFDPRVLGIANHYLWRNTIRQCLAYQNASSVTLVGDDNIEGIPVRHVRVVDAHEQQRDFWIEETDGFRVHRSEHRTPFRLRVTIAQYDEPTDELKAVLPSRVETACRDQQGAITATRVVTVERMQKPAEIPSETWTLAGLELPIGTPVSDLRIKQRIGYWDGQGLSDQPVSIR